MTEYNKAPDVTRQRLYIDAVQEVMTNSSKVMVDVKDGNNMMYLPLDKIMNTKASAEKSVMTSSDYDAIVNSVLEQINRDTATGSNSLRGGR